MSLQVIEGIWEEIQARAAELHGRRLRVIVLPESSASQAKGTLRDFLGEFVGCIDGAKEPAAECAEEVIETLIVEAHRAQGLAGGSSSKRFISQTPLH